jgi:hypothetical protein
MGEKKMEQILTAIYPCDEIIKNANMQIHADFILKRQSNPSILIESKECDINIETMVTDTFIESVKKTNSCGVFISQNSGIIGKPNFHMELYSGNIIVYIQNCQYDIEKIKSAISIIDNLHTKLKSFNSDTNVIINNEVLNEINKE